MIEQKVAVIMVEFQKIWTEPTGDLNFLIKDQLESKKVLSKTEELVNKARVSGIKIIHTPLIFSKGHPEIPVHPTGVKEHILSAKRFEEGSIGSLYYEPTAPKEGDLIASGRSGVSAFTGSKLEQLLRAGNYNTVAVAGFATQVCVESTMRDAYERGFDVILLEDCTAAFNEEQANYVKKHVMPHFGIVMSNEEFFKAYCKK